MTLKIENTSKSGSLAQATKNKKAKQTKKSQDSYIGVALKGLVTYLGGCAAVSGMVPGAAARAIGHNRHMLQTLEAQLSGQAVSDVTEQSIALPAGYVFQTEPSGPGRLFHKAANAKLGLIDCSQQSLGDCYLGAAYMAVVDANLGKSIIDMFEESDDGQLTATLNNPNGGTSRYDIDLSYPVVEGTLESIAVDKDYLGYAAVHDSDSVPVYIMPAIEKAWVQHLQAFPSLKSNQSLMGYEGASSNDAGTAIFLLTGYNMPTQSIPENNANLDGILNQSQMMTYATLSDPTPLMVSGGTFPVTYNPATRTATLNQSPGGTIFISTDNETATYSPTDGSWESTLVFQHAYAVLHTVPSQPTNSSWVTMRNPWGYNPTSELTETTTAFLYPLDQGTLTIPRIFFNYMGQSFNIFEFASDNGAKK